MTPTSAAARRVIVVVAVVHALIFLLILIAFASVRFVPTRLGDLVLTTAALGPGAGVAGFFLWLYNARSGGGPAPPLAARLGIPAMFGVIAGLLCQAASLLLVSWLTYLTGTPGSAVYTVVDIHGGKGTCTARLVVAETHPMGDAFCVGHRFLERHPPGSRVTLVGPVSRLGMHSAPIADAYP